MTSIIAAVNEHLNATWAATGYSVVPRDYLVPPTKFALMNSLKAAELARLGTATGRPAA